MEAEPKIISCEVLRNEVERVNPGYEVDFFEGALHDYPDRMRVAIQERIEATPGEREILLCCGRCSNGTVGLHAGPHRLILPAVDDCISLLLGSRQRYLAEHGAQPGTYYYTRGWIDFIRDPYTEYREIVPKYGEEKASRVARLRNLPVTTVQSLIEQHQNRALFDVLGEARINVLELNLALDLLH